MAYDAANRITRIDSSVDEASVYNYDKTGQLTAAQMTFENNEAYQYDQNGNRTNGGSLHNGAHKNLIKEDAKYQYEYDGENNRTKRLEKATGNYQEYVWDHRNRLQEVRFKTAANVLTKTVKYFYDASDMKVREEVIIGASIVNKYFVYDGGNVVLDLVDTDGHVTGTAPTLDKRYFQGPGVDQLLAQERFASNVSQQVLWNLPDHLGSTRDLVDTLGKVVAHYQYDSFGVLLDGRENVTRYQFTGREHDSNTDFNYHRARWYDPLSGKWMSEDPIGFEAGDANVTRYVGNGVLNGVDPSGLEVFKLRLFLLNKVAYVAFETEAELTDALGGLFCYEKLSLTPDQKRMAGMAKGTLSVEKKVAEVFNAIEEGPFDMGAWLAAKALVEYPETDDFGFGSGFCHNWAIYVKKGFPTDTNEFLTTRTVISYYGIYWPLFLDHGLIRVEFFNPVSEVAYIDNGWIGGADHILFADNLDPKVFFDEQPYTLRDGSPAPLSGPLPPSPYPPFNPMPGY